MKERKKFFDNNRLNRGYKKVINYKQSDINVIRQKFKHILPPIDLINEYEEVSPGTLDKLLDMAKSEQNHRHMLEISANDKYYKAVNMGRYFSLVLVAIISIASIALTLLHQEYIALGFIFASFFAIGGASYFLNKEPKKLANFDAHQFKNDRFVKFPNKNKQNR